jgi:SAM-dependent methyltransferase
LGAELRHSGDEGAKRGKRPEEKRQLADVPARGTQQDETLGGQLAYASVEHHTGGARFGRTKKVGHPYLLETRADRVLALSECRRVVRPGGYIFAAAISRWAARLDAILAKRVYRAVPDALTLVVDVERTGWLPPLAPGDFFGYAHRPMQLRSEARAAGLDVVSLVGIEGAASMLADLDERANSTEDWRVVLDAARATESVPELLGIGPHLLATCRRPDD